MKKFLFAVGLTLSPVIALAQRRGGGLNEATSGLANIIYNLTDAANALIPFFLAIAVVVFIYGVITFILATGADDKSKARNYIIYGIIGIAVIVSLFGVIKLLQSTFGIDANADAPIPQFNIR
jgi:hypothetical protein